MSDIEEQIETGMTAGERLRAAREGLGLSIDDVATSTRIPTRHLSSLETGDFTRLPAPTYSIGFAKSYAGAVGLDRNDIGDQLRAELGGSTRVNTNQTDLSEPMDPARAMPKWLIFAVIAAIIAVVAGASWLSDRDRNGPDNVVAADEGKFDPGPVAATPAAVPANASGPVLITATEQAWIQIKDGTTLLKEGVLEPGQSFAVPPTATAPVLTTGKAEGLRITVGTATAPQVGPGASRVKNVSLLGPALMKGPSAHVADPAPAPASRPAQRPVVRRPAAPPASAPTPSNAAEPAPAPAQ